MPFLAAEEAVTQVGIRYSGIMNLRWLSRVTLVVAMLSTTGCLDDDSPGMSGSSSGNGNYYKCTASISPSSFDYVVQGNTLMLTSTGGASTSLSRVGSGNGIYGSWVISEQHDPQIRMKVKLLMRLESGRVSAVAECSADAGPKGRATASSPADITDSTVTILQADSKTATFR